MRGGVAESFAQLGADDLAQNFGPDRMGAWPAVAAKHVWRDARPRFCPSQLIVFV
jgi:hypothetical protein